MGKELAANTTLSHYRIERKLGAGGMGEVYVAEETRLRRKVALKVLPESVARDKDHLLRFEREAFAASALNHPNILTIYEFGADGDTHFLASEFVAGETLRQRLGRGGLAVSDALDIALQIASALRAAHAAGIIHRDIKPENVMIRADGYVKVLDFGLAKLLAQTAPDGEAETRLQLETQAGMIMGTVAYMSPEQARGGHVDARTDIFSLGCVLYEMLCGRQPFTGETVNHTIVAIMEKEPPPLSPCGGEFPAGLQQIVERCLAKELAARYQSAQDVLDDLRELKEELSFQAKLERTTTPHAEDAKTQTLRAPTTGENQAAGKETNPHPATPSRQSIAVLPFANMSADGENEYFCDGLAEELLNALAKIDDLKVAARTSAFSFKGRNAGAREIGKILNVRTVLEGSVRRSGNRIRITVQLVNAADGYQLWSERYDREMRDIFDVQDEIALAVVAALKVKLLGAKRAAVLRRYTDNTEAYQLYLKGQFHYGKYSEAGWRKAAEYFEQALALEPDYAPAYAGIAAAGSHIWYYGYDAGPEAVAKIRAAIAGALGIDADLSDAYRSQAILQFFVDWDFPAAEQSLARALALNPNDALAHSWHGFWLVVTGRREQAVTAARRALELDPLSLVSGVIAGWTLWFAESYEEGLGVAQTLLGIDQHFGEGFRLLGLSHWGVKNYAAAEDALRKAVAEGAGLIALANLCGVYAHAGRRAEARHTLQQIRAMRERGYVPAVVLAYGHAFLDDVEEALVWLEQALSERNGELVFLGVLPNRLVSFRRDPRFTDLLRRIGLPTGGGRQTAEVLEAETAILSSGELRTELPDDAETRNADVAPTRRPKADPKSEARKTRSLPLFGLLGLILIVGGFFAYRYFTPGSKQIESIAVMPFVNEGGDADAEYLSDGMTETLISGLSQLPNLNVKARSSVFRYKGREADAKTVGRELSVQAILSGRVVQRGDQLTLSLELIDARTENVIWSERYNRRQADLVTLQSEIAREVSGKLKLRLSGADAQKAAKTYTTDPEAYRLYLQGRFYWNKREEREFRKAVEYFNQAVALDPDYALAYVGLADSYAMLSSFGFMPPTEAIPKARDNARRALSLDDSLAEPHATLGYVSVSYDHDFARSEREYRRAIELNPNYAMAHQWYGELLSYVGRFDEAAAEYRRGLALEPLSLPTNWEYGRFFYLARRFDEALAQLNKTVELDPNFARAHRTLSEVHWFRGDYANAAEERAKFFDLVGQPQNGALIRATFAREGWIGFLRLMAAENSPLKDSNNNWTFAKAYVGLGEKDKAFAELNKAYENRISSVVFFKVEPQLDPLRSDPRYQELLKRVGFPQ